MTGVIRFMATRRALAVLVTVAVLGLGVAIYGAVIIRPGVDSKMAIPLGLIVPIVPAFLISASAGSPASAQERGASRRLWLYRLMATGVLVGAGMAMLCAGYAAGSHGHYGVISVGRNFLGFTGLSLIGAAVVGTRLSWIVPLTWLMIASFAFPSAQADSSGAWTFFAQPDASPGALTFCALCAACGIAIGAAKDLSRGLAGRANA